jgi:RNA polymerase sigma factor (TIGR02999 family)
MPGGAGANRGGEITQALAAWQGGDGEAFNTIVAIAYKELRRIARHQLRRARPAETLNTTGLVHEAYLKLAGQAGPAWQDRAHFYAICARAMRQILVDFARRRCAGKRGEGHPRVSLDENEVAVLNQAETLVLVDHALEQLGKVNQRLAQVVECRFFAGLTEEETAAALHVSERTVRRDWLLARSWLRDHLQ